MTTPIEDGVLRDLKARTPGIVLEEIAATGRAFAAAGRQRPDVELGLASGQVIRGKVLALDAGTVVLHTGGQPRTPSVAYVRIDQIAVVTLPDASMLGQAPHAAVDAPAPTASELLRRVAGLLPPVAFAADLDEPSRRALGALLPTLQHALHQIAVDPTAKAQLALLEGIDLIAAPASAIAREGKRLAIHAPLNAADAFTLAGLRGGIERNL